MVEMTTCPGVLKQWVGSETCVPKWENLPGRRGDYRIIQDNECLVCSRAQWDAKKDSNLAELVDRDGVEERLRTLGGSRFRECNGRVVRSLFNVTHEWCFRRVLYQRSSEPTQQ